MEAVNWSALLQSPIIVIIALVIGTGGEVAKRTVKAKAGDTGWKGVYYVTIPAHPVLVGILIGLIPWLPIPEQLTKEGYEFFGRLGTGILGGVVCKVGYDLIISTVRRLLGQKDARTGASDPPPADTSASSEG